MHEKRKAASIETLKFTASVGAEASPHRKAMDDTTESPSRRQTRPSLTDTPIVTPTKAVLTDAPDDDASKVTDDTLDHGNWVNDGGKPDGWYSRVSWMQLVDADLQAPGVFNSGFRNAVVPGSARVAHLHGQMSRHGDVYSKVEGLREMQSVHSINPRECTERASERGTRPWQLPDGGWGMAFGNHRMGGPGRKGPMRVGGMIVG